MPLDRLQRATNDGLVALAAAPVFEQMVAEGPPHTLLVAWLRIMAVVIGEIERALDRVDAIEVREAWCDEPRARVRLSAELAGLDDVPARPTLAIEPMIAAVEELRRWALQQPSRLLGALHVARSLLAGARLPVLSASVTARASLTRASGESLERWLRQRDPSSNVVAHVVDGARTFLGHAQEILASLPAGAQGQAIAQALNADAGAHEVTHDPREIMAAVDAGIETWAQHPYYAARYGTRGRRFTRSDSAWLVTLVDLAEPVRRERLDWLGRMLATRGMPTLLLEAHLRHLHQALVAAIPERAARYGGLESASRALAERRLAALPDFDALATGVPHHAELGSLGPIVVSAVVDERLGIPGVVASVDSWLAAPQRLDPARLAAVRQVIERARQC